jgi:ribulose-5-phosphate 4-epimerase/fuculose-1-phosphate aldolase
LFHAHPEDHTPMKQEGVIKFDLQYTPAPPVPAGLIRVVNGWRDWLYAAGLVGQDPARYHGFGFGNISQRLAPYRGAPEARPFLISGTQTGHLARLGPEHYAVVRACCPQQNRVVAEGPVPPSSESMTHGVLYALDDTLRFVMHVHAPDLWRNARLLGLPETGADVAYGTPAMAGEVRRLFRETDVRQRRLFSMAGHEDGLVAFGRTAEAAAGALRRCFRRLRQEKRIDAWHDPTPA